MSPRDQILSAIVWSAFGVLTLWALLQVDPVRAGL